MAENDPKKMVNDNVSDAGHVTIKLTIVIHLLHSQLIENEWAALPNDHLSFSSDSDI